MDKKKLIGIGIPLAVWAALDAQRFLEQQS